MVGLSGLGRLGRRLDLTLARPHSHSRSPSSLRFAAALRPLPPPPQPARRRAMEEESSQDSIAQYMNLSDDEAMHYRVSCRARVRVGLSDLGGFDLIWGFCFPFVPVDPC